MWLSIASLGTDRSKEVMQWWKQSTQLWWLREVFDTFENRDLLKDSYFEAKASMITLAFVNYTDVAFNVEKFYEKILKLMKWEDKKALSWLLQFWDFFWEHKFLRLATNFGSYWANKQEINNLLASSNWAVEELSKVARWRWVILPNHIQWTGDNVEQNISFLEKNTLDFRIKLEQNFPKLFVNEAVWETSWKTKKIIN